MPELSARLLENHGAAVPAPSLSRFLIKEGFTYIKVRMASEHACTKVKEEREIWTAKRQPRMKLEPHHLVFIDETSVNTKISDLFNRTECFNFFKATGYAPY